MTNANAPQAQQETGVMLASARPIPRIDCVDA